jgi:type II secretory pathway component PulK
LRIEPIPSANPEGAHARVVSSDDFAKAHMQPPAVNTKVSLNVDGKFISSRARVINNTSDFAGQADTPRPGHGFI